jgi:hypothetical protein
LGSKTRTNADTLNKNGHDRDRCHDLCGTC